MSDAFDEPDRGFLAPRIPFHLPCVVIGALGYLVTIGVDRLLARLWDVDSAFGSTLTHLLRQLAEVPFVGQAAAGALARVWGVGIAVAPLPWGKATIAAVVFFAIWALFGGALLRACALRLTRDEPFPIRDSLAFGGRHWTGYFAVPVLVAGFCLVLAGLNVAAGAVMSIPFLGSSILSLVLFPLVLLCSLLLVIAVAGGLVGLPLMWCGLTVELNGALDGISRAYSYLFARPFRFLFGYFLAFILMSVVILLAGKFETTVKGTLQAGIWRDKFHEAVSDPPPSATVLERAAQNSERIQREEAGIRDLRNVRNSSWTDWIGFVWMWGWLWIFLLGFKGYALYVFLGGTMSLYLQLRRDVDGTEEREIYPHSEEEWEAGELPPEAKWVGSEGGAEGADEGGPEAEAEAGDGDASPEDAPAPPESAGSDSGDAAPEDGESEEDEPDQDEPDQDEPEKDGPGKDGPGKDGPEKDGPEKDGPGKDGPEKDEDDGDADRGDKSGDGDSKSGGSGRG